MKRLSRPIILLIATVLALALGSCGSKRHTVRGDRASTMRVDVEATGEARDVIAYARTWLGTPYRYGGSDRSGVDCSGLTCDVFLRAAGLKLPRSSREQYAYGKHIDRGKAEPGDLIFFAGRNGRGTINHVGLYIGGGKMIHASSSRGVMISDIDSGYWGERYCGSGRVLAGNGSKGKRRRKADDAVPVPLPGQPLEPAISLDRLCELTDTATSAPAVTPAPVPEPTPEPIPEPTPTPEPAPQPADDPEVMPGWLDD